MWKKRRSRLLIFVGKKSIINDSMEKVLATDFGGYQRFLPFALQM